MSELGSDNLPPVPPAQPLPPIESGGPPSNEARQWAMFTHLSALAGLIVPFGNLLGPLIFWQIKKNEWPFADDQGKEALNFQITVTIAMLVSFVLMFVVIGFLLMLVVGIAWLVFCILAAVKANDGVYYRYPWILRLVK